MSNSPTIVWLRNDLRLIDNPALYHAAQNGSIIPVFIYDPDAMDRDYGAAQKWWLHHALASLTADFKKYDIDLIVKQGDSLSIITDLIEKTNTAGVYWNRSYEAWSIERDSHIKEILKDRDIDAQSFKANLLFEPWTIKNGAGSNYKVFTPFWKACRTNESVIGDELPAPQMTEITVEIQNDTLDLLPDIRWDQKMEDHWDISESGAWQRMQKFFDNGLAKYKEGRDCPSVDYTSRLSPYLRFGMISPRSIWHATNAHCNKNDISESDHNHFLSEIGWREFAHSQLYYYPNMKTQPLQKRFENFPWQHDAETLRRWQTGQTGYPMIDAGMRQLWQTGWMHNRVRMIVGSLLVKHLLHSWVDGEKWFWDTLVDACPANNVAGWQWIGGCGADAAPYFRIFNPMTQGEKFDAYDYVREFVPEIAHLEDKYLFNPWESENPPANYPAPIIDHKVGREQALEAFKATKVE